MTNEDAAFEAHLEGMDCCQRPCATCAPVVAVDYRALLVKFIEHVGREEGITFIRTGRPMCTIDDCSFTPEEIAALVECEGEAE